MNTEDVVVELQKLAEDCDETGKLVCELAAEKLERKQSMNEVDEMSLLSEIVQRAMLGRLSESSLEMIRTVTKKKRGSRKKSDSEE